MGWVRVDDSFYDHEKFHFVGALGMAAWIAGLAYCNRNLTDGFIPSKVARTLIDCDGLGYYTSNMSGRDAEPMDGVDQLVACGLWREVAGGYEIHDYLDYQPSADDVKAERQKNANRQKSWRDRKGSSNGESNAATNAVTGSVSVTAPNPNTQPQSSPPPPTSSEVRAEEVDSIIEEVRELRPEWSKASIRKALCDPSVQERPAGIIRVAMFLIAKDPASKLPGRLRNDGPWWERARSAVIEPVSNDIPWCEKCHSTAYRFVEDDQGRAAPCPNCHPSRRSA